MRRAYLYVGFMLLAAALFAPSSSGQTEKKEPAPRKVELQVPGQQTQQLPAIELPEYVITGIFSLAAPNVTKQNAVETSRTVDVRGYHVVGSRERVTVELESRQKEQLLLNSDVLNGLAMASLGNYFTPRIDLWVGQLMPDYDYRLKAGYHRTKGFVQHADRSGGYLGFDGGMVFATGAMEGLRLGGDVSYGTETYRFYGSSSPSVRRTLSNYHVGLSLAQPPSTGFTLTPSIEYDYQVVSDSAIDTKQNRARVGLNAEMPFDAVTLIGGVTYNNATISGAHSGHLMLFKIGVGLSRFWWNDLFIQGTANYTTVKGMSGQRVSALYPDVGVGYSYGGMHLVSLTYSGSLSFVDLSTSIVMNPYLSAGSTLRHGKVRQVMLAVESDWSNSIRTKLSISNEEIREYGIPFDPLNEGIWAFDYRTAKFWKYQAEGFAKLTPNDYVSGKVVVNSTKNTGSGFAVPYLPELEAAGSFTHWFPFGVSVAPTISYQGVRETGTGLSQKLPGFLLVGFRTEYEPLPALRIFLDAHNLTDKKYELWKGYQAPPFMVTGGLSFRW